MNDQLAEIKKKLASIPADASHAEERVDLLNDLGWHLRDSGDWDTLLRAAEEALNLSQTHSYRRGLTGAFCNLAFAHYTKSDYKSGLAEGLVARQMAKEDGDQRSEGSALLVIALVQWSLGNYDEALEDGFRSLGIAEEVGDHFGMGWGYSIVGGIYESIGDNVKALEYMQKGHRLFAGQGYVLGEARTLSGVGGVYHTLGDSEAALECHRKALGLYAGISNRIGESRAMNDIAVIYQAQGQLDRALKLHLDALRIREEENSRQAQTTSLLNLGRIYLQRKEHEEARDVLERALKIADTIGAKPKSYQARELLSQLCEQRGDFQAALVHFKEFQRLREQVFSEEQSTRLKNLQIGVEVERSQREAEIHRLKNVELKEKHDQLETLVEQLKATQAQLMHSEKMAALGDLVAAIAHELNTPLGAIQTSADVSVRGAERVVEAIEKSDSLKDLLSNRAFQSSISALRKNGQLISTATERISKLVKSLKSFAQLDQAEFQQFCLTTALDNTLTVLEPKFREQRITLHKEYEDVPKMYGYPAQLNQVFMNLLRNAGQAIGAEGTITIRTFRENGFTCVKVSDTGHGIPKEQLDRLFNPGFTVEGSRVKASMSLFTSMNIVQKHGGDIRVESAVGEGTTFTVRLKGLDASAESADSALL